MAPPFTRRLRVAADQAARLCGLLALREREQRGELTLLTYHRVLPDERCAEYPFPSLAMPVSAFREQVRWLADRGDVAPVAEQLARAPFRGRPAYALSFDDGYRDAHEWAAPVLEQAGVRATFFVTTGFVGGRRPLWFDLAATLAARLGDAACREVARAAAGGGSVAWLPPAGAGPHGWVAALKGRPPDARASLLAALEAAAGAPPPPEGFEALSVDQVVDLHRRGHEIGSHSASHELLTALDDAALRREVAGAHATLRDWLGRPAAGFCYPNGDHDERVVACVRDAGHRYACTTRDGSHRPGDDLFRIRRVHLQAERVSAGARRFDETAFRRELCGLYRRRSRAAAAG